MTVLTPNTAFKENDMCMKMNTPSALDNTDIVLLVLRKLVVIAAVVAVVVVAQIAQTTSKTNGWIWISSKAQELEQSSDAYH